MPSETASLRRLRAKLLRSENGAEEERVDEMPVPETCRRRPLLSLDTPSLCGTAMSLVR